MDDTNKLSEELRDACTKIRVKASIPLSSLIPIMQRAADALDRAATPPVALPAVVDAEAVATLHDDGYFTWKRDEFRLKYDRQRAGWRMDVYAAPPASTLEDAKFLAARVRRVCRLAGVPIPDGGDGFLASVAGTLLGTVALNLERANTSLTHSVGLTISNLTTDGVAPMPTPAPASAGEPETVPWPKVTSYAGGASEDGAYAWVDVQLTDGPETTRFVRASASVAGASEGLRALLDAIDTGRTIPREEIERYRAALSKPAGQGDGEAA